MDKYLHTVDDIFIRAHHGFEVEPSSAIWDNIKTKLDNENQTNLSRDFQGLKKIVILLVLLLSGLMVSETRIDSPSVVLNMYSNFDGNLHGENLPLKDINNNDFTNSHMTSRLPYENKPERQENVKLSQFEPQKAGNRTQVNVTSFNSTINRSANFISLKNQQSVSQIPYGVNSSETEIYGEGEIRNKNVDRNNFRHEDKDSSIPRETLSEKRICRVSSLDKPVSGLLVSSRIKVEQKTLDCAFLSLLTNQQLSCVLPDVKTKFRPYWSIITYAGNDWAHYKLENAETTNAGQQGTAKDEIISREKHEPSFFASFNAVWRYSKKMAVKTGLLYSNTSISIGPQKMYAMVSPDQGIAYKYVTSSGYSFIKPVFGMPPTAGDSLIAANAQHDLHTVSMPLMLQYHFQKKKISILPSVGIGLNYIAGASVKTEVEDAFNRENVTIETLKGLRKGYLSLIADASIRYSINKQLAFTVTPQLKYALSPITKSNVVKTFPNSLGIGFGIACKF